MKETSKGQVRELAQIFIGVEDVFPYILYTDSAIGDLLPVEIRY